MQLNPPTKVVFYSSIVVVMVGMIFNFINSDIFNALAVWVVLLGYVTLVLGNILKGF